MRNEGRRQPLFPIARTAVLAAAAFASVVRASTHGKHLGILPNGEPTCRDGVWTEQREQDIIDAVHFPDVQCWRDPPAIKTSYLSPDICARWPNDDDWPTWSPHHTVTPGMKRAGDVIRDFLVGKTVIFVGDSINSLVYSSFICDAAREGIMPIPTDKASNDAHERVRSFEAMAWGSGGVEWVGGPPQPPTLLAGVDTLVSRKGWHHWGRADMGAMLGVADVMVVNYALHYPDHELGHFEAEMRHMFQQVEAFAKTPGKAFIFRETAAEHKHLYDDDEEKLLPEEDRYLGCRCRLYPEQDAGIRHRNGIIERLQAEFPYVTIAPFYNTTRMASDMHEGAWCTWSVVRAEMDRPRAPNEKEPFCCDCTHYAYYPQLWAHLWNNLWHALAETPGMGKQKKAHG